MKQELLISAIISLVFTLPGCSSAPAERIVFTSNRYDQRPEIFVMDADGSEPLRLTDRPANEVVYAPAWSPDSARIAFTSGRDGDAEVYVMNADGSGQTNLTDNLANDDSPDWQPRPSQ